MEIRGFLTTLLALLAIAADAQQNSATPKLVVGITVDQLRQDYMEFFSPLYGEKGFRRLWREGRYYVNADYNFYNPDRASSIASLFTGTVPMIHGIVSRTWLDPSTLLKKDCADDPDFMGNYTNQSTSAALLQATTLGDELKIFFGGKSLVYAVAPEREEAVMAAGHAADGAFWLNVENGMWCGTTYYGTFPYFVSAFNMQEGVDSRGDSLVWKPSRPVSDYKYVYSGSEPYAFEYGFAAGEGRYRRLKTSPLVNSEINRLLFRSFNLSELGRDDIPDLLSVTYYAGPYDSRPFVEIPMETQDAYVRLDRVLGELLDWIDQRVGLQNALVFLTSTGYSAPDRYLPANLNLPGGEFHLERCKALLNTIDKDDVANIVQAQLLFLTSTDSKSDISIYLNTPGGSVSAGLGIYDTMQLIEPDVATICTGMAASMGAILLCAGERGKRSALPHSRVMIHQPLGGAKGQASDIEIAAREIQKVKKELYTILSERTGKPYETIQADADRDFWMTSAEALDYGMIDEILSARKK